MTPGSWLLQVREIAPELESSRRGPRWPPPRRACAGKTEQPGKHARGVDKIVRHFLFLGRGS